MDDDTIRQLWIDATTPDDLSNYYTPDEEGPAPDDTPDDDNERSHNTGGNT
jgi:hypothetical protein